MTAIAENLEARINMICLMIAITENPKARHAIKRDSVGNTRNRTRQTHRRAILIFLNDSDYRRKRRKNKKSHHKKDPIKLCARLREKLLTIAYKSKTIHFKLD